MQVFINDSTRVEAQFEASLYEVSEGGSAEICILLETVVQVKRPITVSYYIQGIPVFSAGTKCKQFKPIV